MNDPHEERIDTVLEGLRNVEPASGMEARILLALQRAEAPQVPARPQRWVAPALEQWTLLWPGYAVAATALAVTAGILLTVHLPARRSAGHRTSIAQGSVSHVPATAMSKAPSQRLASPSIAASTAGSQLARVPRVSQRHGISLLAAMKSHVSEARHGAPAKPADDRSFPAPPLPPTEQERLLLRLVRSEPPRQLAQLTSAIRNTGYERERDAVSEFFAGRPPLRGQEEPAPDVLQTGQQ